MFEPIGTPSVWAGAIAFVLVMLAWDLGTFYRKALEAVARERTAPARFSRKEGSHHV